MNIVAYPPTVLRNRRAKPARAAVSEALQEYKFPLLLILLHIPLGVILYNTGTIGIIHPVAIFLYALRCAFNKKEKLEKIAYLAAYIIGAEVLWRMAQTPIFWEFGKFGTAFLMIVALAQRGMFKIPPLPFCYFILLLPSALITLFEFQFDYARGVLSSTLSGPLLLFVSCWFFSYLKINTLQLRKLFVSSIIPLSTVAVTTLFYTATNPNIEFTGESNLATSGGFGPNQVSAMLGLGAFLCGAGFLLFKNSFKYAAYFGVMALFFTAQSVMTFSRGGMYAAIGAIIVVAFFQLQNLKQSLVRILPIIVVAAVFMLVVFPYLNDFTGGALQNRFEDQDSTGRVPIIESDIQMFMENPILGVGVGNSFIHRERILGYNAMAHTEFARVFSEHGMFGILSLGALLIMTIINFGQQKTSLGRALVAGVVVWGTLFMVNAGMRLAAPAYVWGLCFLTITAVGARKPVIRKPLVNKAR